MLCDELSLKGNVESPYCGVSVPGKQDKNILLTA
jgi:hypothetical protein